MKISSGGGAWCLQQPGPGHHRFPGARGGVQRGARASGNLIVIQTVPMEGDPEPVPVRESASSTAFLRPQDKWETKDSPKPKGMSASLLTYVLLAREG